MADREFEAEYGRSRRVIAQIDAVMQRLDALRAEAGLSKAELARRVGKEPATVRRLFSSHVNPTLETVVAIADELGASVHVVAASTAKGSPKGG
jgi:transcriptional regulator with XRE-family HTH domain